MPKAQNYPDLPNTPLWMNFYGAKVKLLGLPSVPTYNLLWAGDLIECRVVERNIVVGRWLVKEDGKFGFMPVYGKVAKKDTGAQKGDWLRFYIKLCGGTKFYRVKSLLYLKVGYGKEADATECDGAIRFIPEMGYKVRVKEFRV